MTDEERALAGYLYHADEEELSRRRWASRDLSFDYNQLRPTQFEERWKMLKDNMGSVGEGSRIMSPFFCDFWDRAVLGKNFFANYNFVLLCGNMVTCGDNVWIGPDVGIYSAGHPFDVERRIGGLEYALPIVIGNNVWIGGHVCVLSGAKIGDNAVIAAGSVVTGDIPANVLAGGNPCRVIREITSEDDRRHLQKYHDRPLGPGLAGLMGEQDFGE